MCQDHVFLLIYRFLELLFLLNVRLPATFLLFFLLPLHISEPLSKLVQSEFFKQANRIVLDLLLGPGAYFLFKLSDFRDQFFLFLHLHLFLFFLLLQHSSPLLFFFIVDLFVLLQHLLLLDLYVFLALLHLLHQLFLAL